MKGLTLPLWPVHPKPFPDELLSSWLVRLAHGHGLKVQSFCNLIFGSQRQVWNRDIDRLAPTWLIDELNRRTGTHRKDAWNTTLHAYRNLLFRKFRREGSLQWILVLQMYHRKRRGYGLQFCPACLTEDAEPYFRKRWRVAFNTVCSRHGTMLRDRCHECGAAITFHRLEMGRPRIFKVDSLSNCHVCGADLCEAPKVTPVFCDDAVSALLLSAIRVLDSGGVSGDTFWNVARFDVLHHLCKIMTTTYKHVHLREFVLSQMQFPDILLTEGRVSIEMRPIEERHHLVQLAMWLMVSPAVRLSAAWRAGAVRYNVLRKDFEHRPGWYDGIVGTFSDWRSR